MNEVLSSENAVRKDLYADGLMRLGNDVKTRRNRQKIIPAAEQLVFDFEGALLRGNLSGKIFGAVEYGEIEGGTARNGAAGESLVFGDLRTTDGEPAAGVLRESQNLERGKIGGERNGIRYGYLSGADNYRLTDAVFQNRGGAKKRLKDNIAAIKLLEELKDTQMPATSAQQEILARYCGWGGLSQAFDGLNTEWSKEYKELKELLPPEEYKLAKSSVLTAHYTSKTVIDGIYEALKRFGFSGGTILEPALGTGNFLGLMPSEFNAKVYGVELDNITGRIAKHLYPQANIQITGFEKTSFPNGFFDSVITNVPFGSYKVFDKDYQNENLFIHDYFILKSLDKLRPGGIAAIITSKGTLDKANNAARLSFYRRANLLGAIRLPNNAFKENANTEVTTDILFFQKSAAPETEQSSNWLELSENSNGVPLNRYFIDNPHMVLGTMKKGMSMYGGEDETYCEFDGRDLQDALAEAIKKLPQNIYTPMDSENSAEPRLLADGLDIKNYCYGLVDDAVYLRVDSELIPQYIPFSNRQRLIAMIELRSLVRQILQIQIEGCSDEILQNAQENLTRKYDRFVWNYGFLNSKINKTVFRDDADFTLLLSLENYDEITQRANKTDIFFTRTIRKYSRPESAETVLEALHIAKNETGLVDLKMIQQLTGKSFDRAVEELDGIIYRNPAKADLEDKYSGWETAAEYLSGNVREKLSVAQKAITYLPEFEKNIEALSKAQPVPLTASEISVRMGVSWIKHEIYKRFLVEKFKIRWIDERELAVGFNTFTGQWKVESNGTRTFESANTYGTPRMNGFKLYEQGLNLQTPSIYDTVPDENGKEKRVLNKPETIAAREKLRKIQEDFKAWIFDDPVRREELVQEYNERFNNLVLASYDGSYLTFPEMNPLIELKPHQKDAVERIITSGNTLLHHVVGAGKTFEVAAAAMKLRQLKLAQKPMIIVPNHLVMQWANEFRTLYPNAKLLIATKKDFEKENRLRFVSRIATGDWDAVVMAMSSFERLPISQERQERKIQEEIRNIECALEDLRLKREKRYTVKIMEKILANKKAKLESLSSSPKDDLIRFEELGVDYLFVDEAHKYKNKFVFTKMNNVAGISNAASKRAADLDMKIDYIQELHGGQKGVVFATGTPISNSMVEMYTMQSYLAKGALEKAGLDYFDSWAAVFGETVVSLELAPSGQGYRSRTRFAKFVNLPELLKMYRSFADVKTQDMLNLPVPKANKKVITIKPTDIILELNETIAERAEAISYGNVNPQDDNMLKVTGDGKKLALDPRCFNPSAIDDPQHKVNVCAENLYRIWDETKSTRRTQLIFCDLSTPKKAFKDYDSEKDFDVYNHLKTKLVSMGVPEKEIVFIHEAESDIAKQVLFDNVRTGKVRILVGSTEKCGAGTNVQNMLKAIHHLDTPYRPSDMEQREGRGIRQGNENPEIDIYTYVTERTFDAYSYQILENKQKFISQINKGELTVREASDIDEATLSYSEIKAITSANPLIKRKFEVENELGSLRVLQAQYKTNRYAVQDNTRAYLPKAIENAQKKITDYHADIVLRNDNLTDEFYITVNGKPYTERREAAEALHRYISNANAGKKIASMNGFDISPEFADAMADTYVLLQGQGSYRVQTSESALGTLTRIENFFKSMENNLATAKEMLTSRQSELTAAQEELKKPFEYEQKVLDLSGELADIDAQLDLNKSEIAPVIDDEKFKHETNKEAAELDESDEEQSAYFESDEPKIQSSLSM